MARAVIDIDDEKLAEAAAILGTSTKVATVNSALEDIIKRRKRASFLGWPADYRTSPDPARIPVTLKARGDRSIPDRQVCAGALSEARGSRDRRRTPNGSATRCAASTG